MTFQCCQILPCSFMECTGRQAICIGLLSSIGLLRWLENYCTFVQSPLRGNLLAGHIRRLGGGRESKCGWWSWDPAKHKKAKSCGKAIPVGIGLAPTWVLHLYKYPLWILAPLETSPSLLWSASIVKGSLVKGASPPGIVQAEEGKPIRAIAPTPHCSSFSTSSFFTTSTG